MAICKSMVEALIIARRASCEFRSTGLPSSPYTTHLSTLMNASESFVSMGVREGLAGDISRNIVQTCSRHHSRSLHGDLRPNVMLKTLRALQALALGLLAALWAACLAARTAARDS